MLNRRGPRIEPWGTMWTKEREFSLASWREALTTGRADPDERPALNPD